MFICTLECRNQQENIGIFQGNSKRKMWERVDDLPTLDLWVMLSARGKTTKLGWGTISGATLQIPNYRTCYGVLCVAQCPIPFHQILINFLVSFSTLICPDLISSFCKYLDLNTQPTYTGINKKITSNLTKLAKKIINNSTNKNQIETSTLSINNTITLLSRT